jgi:hypothetical protein
MKQFCFGYKDRVQEGLPWGSSALRCDIPERGSVVKRFSRFSSYLYTVEGHKLHAEARSFVLNVSVMARCNSLSRQGRRTQASIAHGLFIESGRSRSFLGDCTSSHPFVHPLALRQALRRLGPPGTVLFSATILRNQARPNQTDVPLGSLPKDP